MKELLSLKSNYKSLTGTDWSPNTITPEPSEKKDLVSNNSVDMHELNTQIKVCGDKVRDLKTKKAEKVLSNC